MMRLLRHYGFKEEDRYLKLCSHPRLQHFLYQGRRFCACRYWALSCLWCGRANVSTMISWFHHVVEVIVLKCPLQDTLVPIDVPHVHLAFALVDGICHVFVKLRAIGVPSNTSCKHGRNNFPWISVMCRHVQFSRLQARVEYFYLVCQFRRNPQCTILLMVLW